VQPNYTHPVVAGRSEPLPQAAEVNCRPADDNVNVVPHALSNKLTFLPSHVTRFLCCHFDAEPALVYIYIYIHVLVDIISNFSSFCCLKTKNVKT